MEQLERSLLLRDIILNTNKPLVFQKFSTNWKCFDCSLEEWCTRCDLFLDKGKQFNFEQMPTQFGDFPQWERYRSKLNSTLTEFLKKHSKCKDNWSAFNYKPNVEIPIEGRHDIDFTCFGFPNGKRDYSFWLSSKGANTPCHYDTYGCNIVVQVYGRKQWLLFPPETKLTPVRVPYEESSVYCSENFFSPKNLENFVIARENAFECVLDAGDVLIVPRNWWHYVESLETSLSVNTWIPLKIDADAQVEECIVKYIIENTLTKESEGVKHYILNPNQLPLIAPRVELFEILWMLANKNLNISETEEKYSYKYLSEEKVESLIISCEANVRVLQLLAPDDFDNILCERTKRYKDMEFPDECNIHPVQEALLNAICHPHVVNKIKDVFLSNLK